MITENLVSLKKCLDVAGGVAKTEWVGYRRDRRLPTPPSQTRAWRGPRHRAGSPWSDSQNRSPQRTQRSTEAARKTATMPGASPHGRAVEQIPRRHNDRYSYASCIFYRAGLGMAYPRVRRAARDGGSESFERTPWCRWRRRHRRDPSTQPHLPAVIRFAVGDDRSEAISQ